MLKALELSGFKSFADKTRFEFPEGITVVVGPNGSGKSNIVDGIKWVLGAQSAKALRGKDMSDVIFKGSGGSSGRKPANTAEATIIIDNSNNHLGFDATEVHVTRRVYRSGEGEYLINGQPARLKDIRDLFRGTGVGVDAYSLIEQGKVDQMLQATPKDRRAMFEEAAGISRFKAKKIEAQRRLERVDQNLLRLSDIVEEVGSRLRSVRSQAGKARRYKEYSDRLQQLRTFVGMNDWRRLTKRLDELVAEREKLGNESDEVSAKAESLEARSLELEVEINGIDETIRETEGRLTKNRERIAAMDSTIEHERSRCHDLEEEEVRHHERLVTTSSRAGGLQQRLKETQAALELAESEHKTVSAELSKRELEAQSVSESLDTIRGESEQRRSRHVEQMRLAATLGSDVTTSEIHLDTATALQRRCSERLDKLQSDCDSLASNLTELKNKKTRLEKETEDKAVALEDVQRRLEDNRRHLSNLREESSKSRLRHSGANERISVLRELERKLDGIGAGVKDVIAQAQAADDGPFAEVRGLVAELIETEVKYAAAIDTALGELSQHMVVDGNQLVERLRANELDLTGRVGFVPMDITARVPLGIEIDLSDETGVVGRADQLVHVDSKYQSLMEYLLGRTWIVEDLSTALQLNRNTAARIVTMTGELVEPDGIVVANAGDQSIGLVSRRSELNALELEIQDLEQQIELVEQEIDRRQAELYQLDKLEKRLSAEHNQSYVELTDTRAKAELAGQRFEQAEKERTAVESELSEVARQIANTSEKLRKTKEQRANVESEISELEAALAGDSKSIDELDSQFNALSRDATSAKVQAAKSEQQVNSLRTQLTQFEEAQSERERAIAETRAQLKHCLERRQQAERTILRSTSEVAELYLRKEEIARESLMYVKIRGELTSERSGLSSVLQEQRKALRKIETKRHEVELAAGEVRHERNTLDERMKEDYGIDIASIKAEETEEEERKRTEIEEEIADLRRKINHIGAVNTDALEELDDLETRHHSLESQYKDLNDAKESLERIISKINIDSRRLFAETLEAVRTNFQVLYRKAFGGGRADIVLEEGVDLLEAGVDIIATPPGKPEFSNSLLSGGEKALTAVSLLLAIFQYRPSPFCVLDEVDAPFDEANIGRFIDVLKEFLGWTKFVIVTHSKKTMTAATTLYGVTMQESGVSKQVSVKFEDVSHDGQISAEAVKRQEADDADAA